MPVLRLIRKQHPRAEVYWWIETGLAPLLEGDPDLAGVVRFDRRGWAAPRNWREVWRSVQWMRAQNFDWVIDLQCLARSGAFAWLANGELTVGLDEPREGARGYYDLAARRQSWHTHAVDWYLSVLPLLGVAADVPYEWMPERPKVASELRRRFPLTKTRWVSLQPGARWNNKRWPAAHFVQVVKGLAKTQPDLRFAVLGGKEDQALGHQITGACGERVLDLTGKLSLLEMVEWIRGSALMISNDTGPMHVAAALGKPVVALFGPTEPRRTGPYGQLDNVLQQALPCVPCMKSRCRWKTDLECLVTLSPDRVLHAAERLLEGLH